MSILENRTEKKINIIKQEVFYFFSAAAAVFALLEIIFPNFILAYFNLNYLFLAWLASGLVNITKK